MTSKRETLFKNRVREDLKTLKNIWFMKIQQVALRGTPDFLLCVNGRFVAIELKRDGDADVARLQEYHLKQIRDAKGLSYLITPKQWPQVFAELTALAS